MTQNSVGLQAVSRLGFDAPHRMPVVDFGVASLIVAVLLVGGQSVSLAPINARATMQ